MAEDISAPAGGPRYAQDFNLEAVDIITDYGDVFKLKHLVIELSFFEDIYSFACSGNVVLRDAVGIIEKLRLDGSEFIQIIYGKSKNQSSEYKNSRKYRLYKVGNRKPSGNKNSEFFTMYFSSEELFLSEQLKISKSFKGTVISDIVKSILLDEFNGLKVNPKKIKNIQQTYGVYDFVIPRLKPFEAISWLSTYARPGIDSGADMLFYETNDGFYFQSIQSMFESTPYATYKYQPSDLNFKNKAENMFNILDYEFVKTYDTLEATNSGMYANRLISIDPIKRTKTVTNFSKDELGYTQSGSAINRFGKHQTEMYESSLKLAVSNSNQIDQEYISQKPDGVAKDIYIETYVPNRTAQIALSNYTLMKAIIPGDSTITAGRTVNILLYSLGMEGTPTAATRQKDEYFSGIYLVTAVRHIIQTQGVYQTILELAKENTKLKYQDQSYVGAVNE
jgi:hypothetical protein